MAYELLIISGLAAHSLYGCVDRTVPKRPRVSVGGLMLRV